MVQSLDICILALHIVRLFFDCEMTYFSLNLLEVKCVSLTHTIYVLFVISYELAVNNYEFSQICN